MLDPHAWAGALVTEYICAENNNTAEQLPKETMQSKKVKFG